MTNKAWTYSWHLSTQLRPHPPRLSKPWLFSAIKLCLYRPYDPLIQASMKFSCGCECWTDHSVTADNIRCFCCSQSHGLEKDYSFSCFQNLFLSAINILQTTKSKINFCDYVINLLLALCNWNIVFVVQYVYKMHRLHHTVLVIWTSQ